MNAGVPIAAAEQWRTWKTPLVWPVMLFVCVAGFAKLMWLRDFDYALSTWQVIPPGVRPWVVILVPVCEVYAAGMWMAGVGRSWCERAVLSMLVVFSAVHGVQWAAGFDPKCGCLGALAEHLRFAEGAPFVAGRNALLLLLLGAGMVRGTPKESPRGGPADQRQVATADVARGFSIIELLVVIVVVSVLLALLAPSIARVRDSARESQTLSNLRGHATIFETYTHDYKDSYPVLTDPRATYSIIRCESAGIAYRAWYFEAIIAWNVGLADQYYSGDWDHPSFASPWVPGPGSLGTSYDWSCTFLASPAFFSPYTREALPNQLRVVRAPEVVFPSSKAIFVDYTAYGRFAYGAGMRRRTRDWPVHHALVDGSAAAVLYSRIGPHMDSGDAQPVSGDGGPYGGHDPANSETPPMMHTIDGVRGRDLISN